MNKEIKTEIGKLLGQECCRVKIWSYESLSLGFGKKIVHNDPKLNDKYYGEWEIGTYSCAWRIRIQNIILLGSDEPAETNIRMDHINKLNRMANKLDFGRIVSLDSKSHFDIEIKFKSGLTIECFTCAKYKDERFHVFCPNNKSIIFDWDGKWKIGPSELKLKTKTK
jgi:hypothetical protein